MPTTPLQPGSTNTQAVKQLQDWLVQMGYMTSAQVATGYGTYGPQTTKAIAKYQTDHGVDNSSGVGYWGPKTIQATQTAYSGMANAAIPSSQAPATTPSTGAGTPITGQPNTAKISDTSATTTTTTPTTTSKTTDTTTPTSKTTDTTSTTGQGIAYDPSWSKYGITQDVWNSLNATQQGVVGVSLNAATSLYGANASNVTLQSALAAAATDPNIIAKYADALKLDTAGFQQTIQQIQTAASVDAQTKQMQFEADRKALAEQAASAGQAYSGFRGKAEQNLTTTESGIVTSSRSALQKSLQDATSAFEAKYGTSATTPATAQFTNPYLASATGISGLTTTPTTTPENLTGTLAGGVTGTEPIAKQQDINTLAGQYVSLGQLPATKPVTA